MDNHSIFTWLGTTSMLAITVVVVIAAPFEFSLLTLAAYFTWRIARIGLFLWFMKWRADRRSHASPALV